VIHWWTSGGESAAIRTGHCLQQSRWDLVDSAVAGGDAARAQAISRIGRGNPPTAAQFNTSKQYHDVIKEGLPQQRRHGRCQGRLEKFPARSHPQQHQGRRPLLRGAGEHHMPAWF